MGYSLSVVLYSGLIAGVYPLVGPPWTGIGDVATGNCFPDSPASESGLLIWIRSQWQRTGTEPAPDGSEPRVACGGPGGESDPKLRAAPAAAVAGDKAAAGFC